MSAEDAPQPRLGERLADSWPAQHYEALGARSRWAFLAQVGGADLRGTQPTQQHQQGDGPVAAGCRSARNAATSCAANASGSRRGWRTSRPPARGLRSQPHHLPRARTGSLLLPVQVVEQIGSHQDDRRPSTAGSRIRWTRTLSTPLRLHGQYLPLASSRGSRPWVTRQGGTSCLVRHDAPERTIVACHARLSGGSPASDRRGLDRAHGLWRRRGLGQGRSALEDAERRQSARDVVTLGTLQLGERRARWSSLHGQTEGTPRCSASGGGSRQQYGRPGDTRRRVGLQNGGSGGGCR